MKTKTLFRLTWTSDGATRHEDDHPTEADARLAVALVRTWGHTPVRLERLDPSPHHDRPDFTTLEL